MKHLLMFVALSFPSIANAYETDVHLGLTAILAKLAGFGPKEALIIANADQALDRDLILVDGKRHDAVHVVTDEIIFESDKSSRTDASRRVQYDHFPGTAALPIEPKQRMVIPGLVNNLMKPRLETLSKVQPKDGKWLELIGYTLHPYQDSWSHAGIPDIAMAPVLEFRSQYSWGHPDQRGGWSHHRADLTCADVSSTLAMAKATFDQLRRLCDSVTGTACVSSGWTQELEKSVSDFAALDTQFGKRTWLSNTYKAIGLPDFKESLSDIDLPWTAYKTQKSGFVTVCTQIPKQSATTTNTEIVHANIESPRATRLSPYIRRIADEYRCNKDAGLQTVSNQFINWWLTESRYLRRQDFLGTEGKQRDKNFSRYFDSDHMNIQMQKWLGDKKVEDAALWPAVFLRIWLVEDHGIIEALGHADPSSPGYETLRDFLFDNDRFRAEKPDSRLISGLNTRSIDPSTIESQLKDIYSEDFSGGSGLTSCALNVRFPSRLPRDAVTFIFVGRPNSDDWRIKRLGWLSL